MATPRLWQIVQNKTSVRDNLSFLDDLALSLEETLQINKVIQLHIPRGSIPRLLFFSVVECLQIKINKIVWKS